MRSLLVSFEPASPRPQLPAGFRLSGDGRWALLEGRPQAPTFPALPAPAQPRDPVAAPGGLEPTLAELPDTFLLRLARDGSVRLEDADGSPLAREVVAVLRVRRQAELFTALHRVARDHEAHRVALCEPHLGLEQRLRPPGKPAPPVLVEVPSPRWWQMLLMMVWPPLAQRLRLWRVAQADQLRALGRWQAQVQAWEQRERIRDARSKLAPDDVRGRSSVLRDELTAVAWPAHGTVRVRCDAEGASSLVLTLPAIERWWPEMAPRADADATRLFVEPCPPPATDAMAAAWALTLLATCYRALPNEARVDVVVDLGSDEAGLPARWGFRVSAADWRAIVERLRPGMPPSALLAAYERSDLLRAEAGDG